MLADVLFKIQRTPFLKPKTTFLARMSATKREHLLLCVAEVVTVS